MKDLTLDLCRGILLASQEIDNGFAAMHGGRDIATVCDKSTKHIAHLHL